ncbi:hypothetical protein MPH_03515 [Macrophomina phaseolina MS6]|uniref:3-carboxymuconate cyclase n=2 Tax=Macrophomina phaseolina TaxID=35725 RepID=K2SR22_MACPH|nr:hypothetical protein MPH_03515 [Macrophomina phaseolina MS6]KAH7054488.1 hypothetical protein B0J12DRAFT_454826 [Macrophomina phaseolina]
MPSIHRTVILPLILLVDLVSGLPHHTRDWSPKRAGKAIYLLTNDAQNAVIAVPIAADGTLSGGTVTATSGGGANSIDGATNTSAAPDALVGQSALTVAGNNLFAVNAGSNTLTMLSISPSNSTALTPLGRPAALPGDFPNTVAASAKHNLACVGMTGARAGIACAKFSGESGLGTMDGLRSFDLGQTTPPVGPTNTVSQVFFSADEARLFATVKGDPAANKTGFFSVFPVEWQQEKEGCAVGAGAGAASVSMRETRSSPEGTAVLFGAALVPRHGDGGAAEEEKHAVFVTDASFGGAVLEVDSGTNAASLVARQEIAGQKATCWATVSEATGSAFVTDVGVNRVVEMSLKDATIISTLDLSRDGDPGLIDLKAAGDFVYALSPGNGTTPAAVTVFDVSGGQGTGKMIQHFDLSALGAGKNAQGMAVMV